MKEIILRINRWIQVKGVFRGGKKEYGFRRFIMCGNIKVITKFLLMIFKYNVNKLYNKTLQKSNGKLVHKKPYS